mmetsp:Transcript_115232/g.366292  ORF Transcript_115232/g.366292 Transcript_115232/m.366292 type:complete len:1132 (-) Transcript_115232:97-3492(-)
MAPSLDGQEADGRGPEDGRSVGFHLSPELDPSEAPYALRVGDAPREDGDGVVPVADFPIGGDWEYDRIRAGRDADRTDGLVGSFQCCTSRRRPEPEKTGAESRPIWETSDLSWLDFQRRHWSTLWHMRTMYNRMKKCESDSEALGPGPEQDKLWHDSFALTAVEMRKHAEEAKGCFIKAGQVMSTMVGVLPDEITSELMSLTDHLPVSTPEEVFRMIRKDLGHAPRDVFSSFDLEPVASASIAQVHKARLRSTGQVVAVKVQHEGVDKLMMEDMNTLTTVAGQVAYWSPDLDFRNLVEEMREVLPSELDFREERRALDRAGKVLRREGNPCIIPRVHKTLFGPHVFVMEFVDAMPIMNLADPEFCKKHQVDKLVVVRSLVDAFCIMAFKDGLFHADPHAGNIRMVLDSSAPGGARPVIFDWGLFKEVDDHERLVSAKVFHCLGNFDVAGVFDALALLGFSFKAEAMTDDFRREILERARNVMKDTVSRETVRANVKIDMAEQKERVRKAMEEGKTAKASYSPLWFLDGLPKCVMAFLRMLQILRGLCVALDAQGLPILQILCSRSREALQQGSLREKLSSSLKLYTGRECLSRKLPSESETVSPRSAQLPVRRQDVALEERIRAKLEALREAGRMVGAQVAVVSGGAFICDVSGGSLSSTDSRPVRCSTRFPMLGAVGGVGALAVLRALRRLANDPNNAFGITSVKEALNMPVARFWPGFGGGGSGVTLRALLGHAAGLQDAFPVGFSASHLDRVAAMSEHLEQVPLQGPYEPRYAYLLQAFALTRLGDCMANADTLLHWLGAELGPLGLDAAAPAGGEREASVCRELQSLARVSMTEVEAGRDRRKIIDETSAAGVATCSLMQAATRDPLGFDPLQGNAGNGAQFRGGLSLGASARGLATMLSSETLQQELEALGALERAGSDNTALGWLLTGGASQWTSGGLQVLPLRSIGGSACLPGRSVTGFGIVCGLGPCLAHFPGLGSDGGLTVAITVNDVLHGRAVAAELMSEVLSGFGYCPAWTSMPMRVMADAARLARSEELEPLMKMGGLQATRAGLLDASRGAPSAEASKAAPVCCAGLLSRQGPHGGATRALRSLGARCLAGCGGGGAGGGGGGGGEGGGRGTEEPLDV